MLLVTDSEENEALFRQSVEQSGLRLQIHRAGSAAEAISILKQAPPFGNVQIYPANEVIVIDLVRGEASELLLWLQTRPEYQNTHTVVITANPDPASVTTAYSLKANAVLARPAFAEERAALYRSICRVWSLSEPVVQSS